MKRSTKAAALLSAVAIAAGASLAAAPMATAAEGNASLASVLTAGKQGFDKNHGDYDVVTAAVLAVLGAKPDSAVGALAQGDVALTAFIPTDRAFMNLASALTGTKVTREEDAFAAVAGLGIPTVEKVLLYHVVPGSTIASTDALKADGVRLQTALGKKWITVDVTSHPTGIILRDRYRALPDPSVILSQVDINVGNKQIAHGIDEVLMPQRKR